MALTLASLWIAKLLIILRITVPPDSDSIFGAMVSAIVLTAFAPIASLQSTKICAITIGPDIVSIILTSTSLHPPPNLTNIGSTSLHI